MPITGREGKDGKAGDSNEMSHLGEDSEVPHKHPSDGRRLRNVESRKQSRKSRKSVRKTGNKISA